MTNLLHPEPNVPRVWTAEIAGQPARCNLIVSSVDGLPTADLHLHEARPGGAVLTAAASFDAAGLAAIIHALRAARHRCAANERRARQ